MLLVAACGGDNASSPPATKKANNADVYTAVLKHLLPSPIPDEDKPVVYVAPFPDQKAITLETQAGVISNLADLATVRFVDDLSEAVDTDEPDSPAKGAEVVLLGPVVATGDIKEVDALSYASETDQTRYRFRVSSTPDGIWSAQQVEAIDIPPTSSA